MKLSRHIFENFDFFNVLLTLQLSKILVTDQLNARILVL